MKDEFNIKNHIREVPNFPKPPILFYDISTLIAHPVAWKKTLDILETQVSQHKPDLLIGVDARGFIPAAALADRLGLGLVMARKKGKLPGTVISETYEIEYGDAIMEIQPDIIKLGSKVVIIDDLLAKGGTMAAAVNLARKAGADVLAAATIIELDFLNGRAKIDVPVISVVSYADEKPTQAALPASPTPL